MCSYHNLKITFHKSVVGNILECSRIPKIIKIWLCFKLEVQSALKYRSLMLKKELGRHLSCNYLLSRILLTRSIKHHYCTITVGFQPADEIALLLRMGFTGKRLL